MWILQVYYRIDILEVLFLFLDMVIDIQEKSDSRYQLSAFARMRMYKI